MKKEFLLIAILIILFTMLPLAIMAQNGGFGIKGGAAGYQITNDVGGNSATSDRKIGFEAGVFAELPLGKIFSIQPEAVFVQKGGEESGQGFGASSITLNYVDVPLLIKINAPLDGSLKPFIFGGPYAGYLIEATSSAGGEDQDLTDFLNELNYGVKIGIGLNFGPAQIDARYDMGIANLYKEDEELNGFDGNFEITTSGIVISLALKF